MIFLPRQSRRERERYDKTPLCSNKAGAQTFFGKGNLVDARLRVSVQGFQYASRQIDRSRGGRQLVIGHSVQGNITARPSCGVPTRQWGPGTAFRREAGAGESAVAPPDDKQAFRGVGEPSHERNRGHGSGEPRSRSRSAQAGVGAPRPALSPETAVVCSHLSGITIARRVPASVAERDWLRELTVPPGVPCVGLFLAEGAYHAEYTVR